VSAEHEGENYSKSCSAVSAVVGVIGLQSIGGKRGD